MPRMAPFSARSFHSRLGSGLFRAFVLGLALAGLTACGGKPESAPAQASGVSSLQSVDLKTGDGEAITAGKMAVVQYTGWLYEAGAKDNKGKEFDSSRNTGQPFQFTVGAGQVIKGWDQGVAGMKVGGSRRLIIPPDLAYGDGGAGPIPAGATLVFDIDLVGIQ
jgi:FKBP-type peptidyl-prolyl cis-trans isomerase